MKMRLLIVLLVTIHNCQGQTTPTGRATAHLFYFPSVSSPLLFDGYEKMNESPSQSEIWQFKNNAWVKILTGSYPSRKLSAAAFDSERNEVIGFGGIGKDGYDDKKSDMYKFDGLQISIIPANDIGTRDHHEMVYANHLKALVMYGGVDANRKYDTTTWLFKDGKWKALHIRGPGKRVHHAMAYDPERKMVVLFGGSSGGGVQHADTWEFDGTKWRQVLALSAPGVKLRHTMLYDPVRKVSLLLGGKDLWSWDGTKWVQLANDGPDRMFPAVCFDIKREKLILFGGVDDRLHADTWEWDSAGWVLIQRGDVWNFDDATEKYVLQKK